MKYIFYFLIIIGSIVACNSKKTTVNNSSNNTSTVNDTIRIANEELEYEILIFEPGFNAWLATQPPMGHYGIYHLEAKNRRYVLEYNNRVIADRNIKLYEQEINYDPSIRYGMEVNYLLYNYFIFFQEKYKQDLK